MTCDEREPSRQSHTTPTGRLLVNQMSILAWLSPLLLCATAFAQYSTHWAVITSINAPTTAVRTLNDRSGWRTVVVGDLKSPESEEWDSLQNVVYLDVDKQLALGYEILQHLPFHSYARKNIGYLYAIEHGAEVIFDTDDDNIIASYSSVESEASTGNWWLPSDVSTESVTWLSLLHARDGCPVVNPFVHFGQSNVWPRGLPLQCVHASQSTVSSPSPPSAASASLTPDGDVQSQSITFPVQQLLAQMDPDTDAIFRLTQSDRVGHVVFDLSVRPAALPALTLSPVNSQATVFHPLAHWALLIPVAAPFRVCDIWRGYWMQPLLWRLGGRVLHLPAAVLHDRNPHDYYKDFKDELVLYTRSGDLVNLSHSFGQRAPLSDWKSDEFAVDAIALAQAIADERLWGQEQVTLTRAWFNDLRRIRSNALIIHS